MTSSMAQGPSYPPTLLRLLGNLGVGVALCSPLVPFQWPMLPLPEGPVQHTSEVSVTGKAQQPLYGPEEIFAHCTVPSMEACLMLLGAHCFLFGSGSLWLPGSHPGYR